MAYPLTLILNIVRSPSATIIYIWISQSTHQLMDRTESNYKSVKPLSFDSSEEEFPSNANATSPLCDVYLDPPSEAEVIRHKSETQELLAQLFGTLDINAYYEQVKEFLNIKEITRSLKNISVNLKLRERSAGIKHKEGRNTCMFLLLLLTVTLSVFFFVDNIQYLGYRSLILTSNQTFWGTIPQFVSRADYLRNQSGTYQREPLPMNHTLGQLPFCLVIPNVATHMESQNTAEIRASIGQLNYTNYQLAVAADELAVVNASARYTLNYFDYWLLTRKCSRDSYVMFLAAPLQPNALSYLSNKYKARGAWLFHSRQKTDKGQQEMPRFTIMPEQLDENIEVVQLVSFRLALYEFIGLRDYTGEYTKNFLLCKNRRVFRESIVLALYELAPRVELVDLNQVYSKFEVPFFNEPVNFNEDRKFIQLTRDQSTRVRPSSYFWIDFESRTSSYTRPTFLAVSPQSSN